jgi:hypothetical protein
VLQVFFRNRRSSFLGHPDHIDLDYSNPAGTHQLEQSPLNDWRNEQQPDLMFQEPFCTAPFSLHNSSHRSMPRHHHPVGINPSLHFSAVAVHRCAPDAANTIHCYIPPVLPQHAAAPAKAARRRPAALRKRPSPAPGPAAPQNAAVQPYAAALCGPATAAADSPPHPAAGPFDASTVAESYGWGLHPERAAAGTAGAADSAAAAAASEELGAEGAWDPALPVWADCAWDVRSLLDDGPL